MGFVMRLRLRPDYSPFSLRGLEVIDSKKRSTMPLVERIKHWRKHRRRWSLADGNDSQESSGNIPSFRKGETPVSSS